MTPLRSLAAAAAVLVVLGETPLAAQDATVARIDRFLRAHLDTIPIPGFSAVVVKDGRVLLARGYGREVAGRPAPMTERSPVAIGSQTKSFTAVAILQLVERGAIALDAPVTRYLPWFKTADRRGAEITVRMLLNNTSGLPSVDRWLFSRDTAESAIEREVRALSAVPIVRAPGKSFEYANENWSVAGAIITAVTGLPFSSYLEREILTPLGMRRSSTGFARFREIGALWGHYAGPDGVAPAAPRFLAVGLPAGSELRVSAADMGRYLLMLLGKGRLDGTRILSEASVAQLFEPGSVTTASMPEMGVSGVPTGYGMGWAINEIDGRTIIHHGGDAIVMGSWTALDTTAKVAASVFYGGPTLDPYRFPSKIYVVNNLLHLALGEPITDFGLPKEGDPTVNDYTLPATLRARYVGEYRSTGGQLVAIAASAEGPLRARLTGGDLRMDYELDFASEASAVFRNLSGGAVVRFLVTPSGLVTGIAGGLPGGPFRKRSAEELSRVQTVHSPGGGLAFQLPTGWSVRWTGERFVAHGPGGSGVRLEGGIATTLWTELAGQARRAMSDGDRGGAAERTETVGRFAWQELVWRDGPQSDRRQRFLALAEEAGRSFTLEVFAPEGALTPALREVVVPLMTSLELRTVLGDR
ncbi:MAG: serine hydrolase domain-containing protein [Gemmatimonadales bacterium]